MHPPALRCRVPCCGAILCLLLLAGAAAAAPASLPAALDTLRRIGCAAVPEISSAQLEELQCRDDRAYFLCTAMQARDARLDCAIGAGNSKVDWEHQEAAAIIRSPDFAETLKAEPCAAWIYPDAGPDKLRHGQVCAAGILRALDCADRGGHCAAAAPACVALRAAGYVERCR